jgi:hypothetical protein
MRASVRVLITSLYKGQKNRGAEPWIDHLFKRKPSTTRLSDC